MNSEPAAHASGATPDLAAAFLAILRGQDTPVPDVQPGGEPSAREQVSRGERPAVAPKKAAAAAPEAGGRAAARPRPAGAAGKVASAGPGHAEGPRPQSSGGAAVKAHDASAAPATASVAARAPGSMAGALTGMLSALGLSDTQTRSELDEALRQACSGRGLGEVDVVSFVHGVLRLTAPASQAALLSWDAVNLARELASFGVTRLEVRVRRDATR